MKDVLCTEKVGYNIILMPNQLIIMAFHSHMRPLFIDNEFLITRRIIFGLTNLAPLFLLSMKQSHER